MNLEEEGGVNWAAVVRAIRLSGLTVYQVCDACGEMGRDICVDYVYKLHFAHKRNPHFNTGDALLRLLKKRDPAAYDRLYTQTRIDTSEPVIDVKAKACVRAYEAYRQARNSESGKWDGDVPWDELPYHKQ